MIPYEDEEEEEEEEEDDDNDNDDDDNFRRFPGPSTIIELLL